MSSILYLLKGFFAACLGVLIGIFAFFTVGGFIFKDFYKPFIVLSGSMEPTIKTGSVVIVKPSESYFIGDVITFAPNGKSKDLVTHRILNIEGEGGNLSYITKGDANEDQDSTPINREFIFGKSQLVIPYAGFVVNYAKTPQGFILFVIIPATIIVYEELKSMKNEIFKKKQKNNFIDTHPARNSDAGGPPPSSGSKTPRWAVIAPIFGVVFVISFAVTKSFFLDQEQNANNILGASSSFGEETSTLYNSDPYTCPTGATDTTSSFGSVILEKIAGDTQMQIIAKIQNGTPSSTYELWFNQDPGACPLGSPSIPAFITTDGSGNGTATTQLPLQAGAVNYWISLVGGGQVLRSTAVGF